MHRELADQDPDAYLDELAHSLHAYASHLAGVGRGAEALTFSEEARRLYAELAGSDREAYLSGLASSAQGHAWRLAEAGQA